jgi:hypothetical protein
LNQTLVALDVTANPSALFVVPGRDALQTMVRVLVVVNEPAPGSLARIQVRFENLPFGMTAFDAELLRVTQTSSTAGTGVESVSMVSASGSTYQHSFDVATGGSGVYVLELTKP